MSHDDDLWEQHAGWWQAEFTDGADVEYEEQILPLAAQLLQGYESILDLGAGEGQIARLLAAQNADARIVGFDATIAQMATAADRAGGPRYGVADAAAIPSPDGAFDAVLACLVFEHIDEMERAVGEVARVLRVGGRFALFLNHPILQTPGSGWIDDHTVDPPEQYWRLGPYLAESSIVEEVQKDVFIPFVHRPLSRYINTLARHGLLLREMHEPSPPLGFQEKSAFFAAAAAFPRLLVLVCEREGDS